MSVDYELFILMRSVQCESMNDDIKNNHNFFCNNAANRKIMGIKCY